MTVTDVYCLFNRARGTALVSPDDLVNACHLFEKLGLPMRLKTFDSGVLVVQAKSESDEVVCGEILKLLPDNKSWVTALEVSSKLSMSLLLAKEHLLNAENTGKLCRDDTLEGLRFYRNLFLDGFPKQQAL